jgi:hypothetical protein
MGLMLQKAAGMGLSRVLATCDEDSVGSCPVIERNDGEMAGKGISQRTAKPTLWYWIDVARREGTNHCAQIPSFRSRSRGYMTLSAIWEVRL